MGNSARVRMVEANRPGQRLRVAVRTGFRDHRAPFVVTSDDDAVRATSQHAELGNAEQVEHRASRRTASEHEYPRAAQPSEPIPNNRTDLGGIVNDLARRGVVITSHDAQPRIATLRLPEISSAQVIGLAVSRRMS